jgi:hypothetical protein
MYGMLLRGISSVGLGCRLFYIPQALFKVDDKIEESEREAMDVVEIENSLPRRG